MEEVDLYFHGNIDRETAECRLMLYSSADGTYLIRSKDEANFVISVYFQRKIAHYLIIKQHDGVVTWDSVHHYETLENMIAHHSNDSGGMVTVLSKGCPVRYFIVQDSLFPDHECTGLCWFHGTLNKEEILLRLAIADPTNGSFLITTSSVPEALYKLSLWINSKVVSHDVLVVGSEICITLQHKFHNLLDLIKHYMSDDALGHVLMQPCCVSVWQARGQLSHPPQILGDFRSSEAQEEEEEEEEIPNSSLERRLAVKARRKATNFHLNIANISNLSLSDNESPSSHSFDEVDGGSGLGFYNNTYSSDEDSRSTNPNKGTGVTLELHNTLSRKGSNRIKRKSLEKSQRKLQKIQQASRRGSSSDELVLDGAPVVNHSNLKRRNAKEKKRNKKHFLVQSELESLTSSANRLTLDPNSILMTDVIGIGVSSKVYKGTLHDVPVAIKKVNRNSSKWVNEATVVEHDNILRLIGVEKQKIIVTELCDFGPLDQFLLKNDRKVTSPLTILSWLRDICNALVHAESLNIPLRALSCRNIILNSALCAKLSLYSTTRSLNDQGKRKDSYICVYPNQDTHKIRWYPTDNKTCITWSYGVTLLEAIHYAQFKYKDLLDIRYSNGTPIVAFQPHVPIAVRNLIKSCLRQRHSDRPKLKKIVEKLSVVLDLIVKAYNWRVKDPSSLFDSLNLENKQLDPDH